MGPLTGRLLNLFEPRWHENRRRQQATGPQASKARLGEEDRRPSGSRQQEVAGRQQGAGSRQRDAADELVRDPSHLREDEDEGA